MDFSGGSNATHEIFRVCQSKFEKIVVVCNKVGRHSFTNVEIRKYKDIWSVFRIFKSIEKRNTIFYGDFYNSILFVWLKIPFYFTYHDNWPEMRYCSSKDRFRSLFYIPLYKLIFRHADGVIAVSEYKKRYIESFTGDVYLVRNGFNKRVIKKPNHKALPGNVLMVGNIERRKYIMAYRLFRKLPADFPVEFHLYGNILNTQLSDKLDRFNFVKIMGFYESIPYKDYHCFLHTSLIENLPLSICESLFHQVPVIAFNVGGIHEIVNESNGLLIPPFSLQEMAESLITVLNEGQEFSFKETHLDEFDWRMASEKYIQILR
jgi:glycosyltransferase involved in cell wall biosynthesis